MTSHTLLSGQWQEGEDTYSVSLAVIDSPLNGRSYQIECVMKNDLRVVNISYPASCEYAVESRRLYIKAVKSGVLEVE